MTIEKIQFQILFTKSILIYLVIDGYIDRWELQLQLIMTLL